VEPTKETRTVPVHTPSVPDKWSSLRKRQLQETACGLPPGRAQLTVGSAETSNA
jgi:hypothetical protein